MPITNRRPLQLGQDQAWQVVTGSRAIGTVYYNTTGRTIKVHLYDLYSSSGVTTFMGLVNGIVADRSYAWNTNTYAELKFEVPPGASYQVTQAGSPSGQAWSELR